MIAKQLDTPTLRQINRRAVLLGAARVLSEAAVRRLAPGARHTLVGIARRPRVAMVACRAVCHVRGASTLRTYRLDVIVEDYQALPTD